MTEQCWRCSAEMAWVHGTWVCPRCKFKIGCCEGEPQSGCDAAAGVGTWQATTSKPST